MELSECSIVIVSSMMWYNYDVGWDDTFIDDRHQILVYIWEQSWQYNCQKGLQNGLQHGVLKGKLDLWLIGYPQIL